MVITGTGNADPFILFDLVAHNPTASTIQFTFFFDIPATDFTASDLLRTHLNIQLTQGSTISPTHTDGGLTIPIFQMFLGNNDDGDHDADDQWQPQNPLLGLGSDVLTAPSTTIFTSVSPAISSIPVFTFSKTYDSPSEFAVPPPPPDEDSTADGPMSAFVQFTLAADSDAEVTGNINFPEPASMICWTGLGLAFLGAHYWRGRQTAA
jgi:hypothetical protein